MVLKSETDEDALKAFCRERLADFKVPDHLDNVRVAQERYRKDESPRSDCSLRVCLKVESFVPARLKRTEESPIADFAALRGKTQRRSINPD